MMPRTQALADLAIQVAELKAEFQHIAELHPWICLAVLPYPNNAVVLQAGAKAPGLVAPSLGLPGVTFPENKALAAVVDHVNQLTFDAGRLLKRVLECESRIPADVQEEIREAEQRSPFAGGWLCWLQYAAVHRGPMDRYENYPQVAATALWELMNHCRAAPATDPAGTPVHTDRPTSESPADPEWTTPDSPQRWAKVFGFSVDTLKRRFKDKKIRYKKLSSKSYQIAVDDLPAIHQAKFRSSNRPAT